MRPAGQSDHPVFVVVLHQGGRRRLVRFFRRPVLDQFHRPHRPKTPHLPDARVFLEPRLQSVFQESPKLARMLQSLRTVEFVHHRERRRTRHGISGISAPHTADPDGIDHLRFTHHRGERQPVGQTLGQNE